MTKQRPDLSGRNPAVREVMRYFEFEHLAAGPLRDTSERCADLAWDMVASLGDCPMLTTGLNDLLRAKDAFVRAALPR